jgi:hypothetical protein
VVLLLVVVVVVVVVVVEALVLVLVVVVVVFNFNFYFYISMSKFLSNLSHSKTNKFLCPFIVSWVKMYDFYPSTTYTVGFFLEKKM